MAARKFGYTSGALSTGDVPGAANPAYSFLPGQDPSKPTNVNVTGRATVDTDTLNFLRGRASNPNSALFQARKKNQLSANAFGVDDAATKAAGAQGGLWNGLASKRGMLRGGARERLAPMEDVDSQNIGSMTKLYGQRGQEQMSNMSTASQMEGLVGQQLGQNAWLDITNKLRNQQSALDDYDTRARLYGGYMQSRGK